MSAHLSPQRIVIARAVLALIWAAAVVVAIGDRVPTTDAEIPAAAAALLAAYPLTAFGAWAVVCGVIQLVLELRGSRQVPMIISGGLSTVAGISFLSAAGMHEAHLAVLGGYMAVGAALYLASARRSATAPA